MAGRGSGGGHVHIPRSRSGRGLSPNPPNTLRRELLSAPPAIGRIGTFSNAQSLITASLQVQAQLSQRHGRLTVIGASRSLELVATALGVKGLLSAG